MIRIGIDPQPTLFAVTIIQGNRLFAKQFFPNGGPTEVKKASNNVISGSDLDIILIHMVKWIKKRTENEKTIQINVELQRGKRKGVVFHAHLEGILKGYLLRAFNKAHIKGVSHSAWKRKFGLMGMKKAYVSETYKRIMTGYNACIEISNEERVHDIIDSFYLALY